jgi:uncharacterized membrane protein YjfL (UPF0719 family)
MDILWNNAASAAVFAGLGVVLFVVAFVVLDLLTPGRLWDEIGEKRNQAAATLMGCVAIALGIIVAAAIH